MTGTDATSVNTHDAEGERLDHGQRLGGQEQLALVVAVGHGAAAGAEQQHGPELEGGEHADGHTRVVGELEHQQGLGDQREPGAALGDELARRRRGGSCGCSTTEKVSWRRTRSRRTITAPPWGRRAGHTREGFEHRQGGGEPVDVSGRQLGQAGGQPGVLAGPDLGQGGPAVVGEGDVGDATVGGVGGAGHQAGGDELVDHLGGGGRRDLLHLGEGAEGEGTVAADGGEGGGERGREPAVALLAQRTGPTGWR